jgi:CheY-like chemotaxis protein
MNAQINVVIIDDSAEDIGTAFRIRKSLGVETPTIYKDVKKAIVFLEDVVGGEKPCPDLLLLDLDFGVDSGFEVLRLYKTHPVLRKCSILVWTVMGKSQLELCKLFGVENVKSKHHGEAALAETLAKMLDRCADSAGSA